MSKEAYDALINWFPMLLLIGIWLFYMVLLKFNSKTPSSHLGSQTAGDQLSELRRRNELLEKIVKDHDARLQSLERIRNSS